MIYLFKSIFNNTLQKKELAGQRVCINGGGK